MKKSKDKVCPKPTFVAFVFLFHCISDAYGDSLLTLLSFLRRPFKNLAGLLPPQG